MALSQAEIDLVVTTVAGGAANVQDIYPLAPLQKGILFHHLLNTETDPYVLASLLGFDTRGRLDAYVAALQAVVERHDILRTAVVWEGLAEPAQVVWRHAPVPIEDVTVMPEVGWWRRTRLDIRQAPLLRGYVSWDATHAGGQGRWLLSLLFHHLVLDHLTLEVVQDEIIAHLTGRQAELPPPLPFRNFVAQARLGDRPAEHERYFRALLEDVTEPTTPFGLVEVRGDGSGISEAWLAVEAGLARRLRARARALGVSVASLCHVAWAQVLARVTGRTDVVFGTVLLGRMGGSAGADRALGLFMNTLPVRVRVEGVGAEAAVRGMQRQLAELLEHEHASLALAQRCSGVPASSPLFSSLLNYRHSGGKRQPLSPETVRALEGIERLASEDRSNYPVGLSVDNWGEGLGLIAQVEAPAEPGRVCGLMATALERLVGVLEAAPGTALETVDVLPAAERRQVVEEWNATAVAYPREQCVHELFEAQVARTPDAVAVVFEGEQLTYAALNGRANQLARYLQEVYGVGPEVRVALCLERSLELVVALLGVLKAGGCYVPLDPSYPAERLRFMLADSAPAAVLTHGPVLAQGAAELWAGLKLPVVDLSGPHRPWAHAPTGNPTPAQLQAMQAAYMIYTSGSTGQPKGVVIPHRGVTNLLEGMRKLVGITARDRLLSTTTIAFDIAALELFLPMLSGACTILVPVRVSTDASVLADAIVANEPTVMQATPSAWRMLLDAAWSGGGGLRVLCGGEALPSQLAQQLRSKVGALWNVYGPTETTIWSSAAILPVEAARYSGSREPTVSIGRPIANTQVYVLDGAGEPVPVGVVGELYIGGAGVARGYWNRPGLTAEKFVPDLLGGELGARLYRTGDLARWLPTGVLEFLGRRDYQVKIRGYRIELGEIEAVLSAHPAVQTAVVVAREDTPGEKRLVAYYVVVAGGTRPEVEGLRAYLSERVPSYMVPAAYVELAGLPLTPNGKVDRRGLPGPEGSAYATPPYAAPFREVEQALAAIWAEVLGVKQVGRHDDFFALGGHSLLAVQVMAQVRQMLAVEVSLSDIFSHPTIEQLAKRVSRREQIAPDTAIPVRTIGAARPLFLFPTLFNVDYARVLAPHIDASIPIYGLQHQSEEASQLTTMDAIGRRFVRMIQVVQPSGPYRLAGWSFGGVLAYEVAAQLCAQHQIVEFVGLLDTQLHADLPIGMPKSPSLIDDVIIKRGVVSLLNNFAKDDSPYGGGAEVKLLISESLDSDWETLLNKAQQMSVIPKDVTTALVKQQMVIIRAHASYAPNPIPVSVDFFLALPEAFHDEGCTPENLGEWQDLQGVAAVRVRRVVGNHASIMRRPHIQALGQALSHAINIASQDKNKSPVYA